jgi:hypothetical protein
VRFQPFVEERIERFHTPGNFEIMATLTAEITTETANRHNGAIGPIMVNRFIANRFNFYCRHNAIRQVIQLAIAIHMRLTKSALTMTQSAAPKAKVTNYIAVIHRLLQHRFD